MNGNTAFPIVGDLMQVIETGISARDYFAAKALQGILAYPDGGPTIAGAARDAYRYADAMLAERSKHD
jgi:hypothetical protein